MESEAPEHSVMSMFNTIPQICIALSTNSTESCKAAYLFKATVAFKQSKYMITNILSPGRVLGTISSIYKTVKAVCVKTKDTHPHVHLV
jgi:hypothetical protein